MINTLTLSLGWITFPGPLVTKLYDVIYKDLARTRRVWMLQILFCLKIVQALWLQPRRLSNFRASDYECLNYNLSAFGFMMTSSNGNISALLAISAGNSPITGEFPTQRPVTQSFDVFYYLHRNTQLSKRSWGWWFETPSHPLLRHCNVSWDLAIRRLSVLSRGDRKLDRNCAPPWQNQLCDINVISLLQSYVIMF